MLPGVSLAAESGGSSLATVGGLLSLCTTGSRVHRLQYLWSKGSVAVVHRHVASSQTRD